MSAQFRAAFLRAALGALLAFGLTYATTITTVEDDCRATRPAQTRDCEQGTDTKEAKALWPSIAAALAYIGARAGVEGAYDTRRQQSGNQKEGDVKKKPGGGRPA